MAPHVIFKLKRPRSDAACSSATSVSIPRDVANSIAVSRPSFEIQVMTDSSLRGTAEESSAWFAIEGLTGCQPGGHATGGAASCDGIRGFKIVSSTVVVSSRNAASRTRNSDMTASTASAKVELRGSGSCSRSRNTACRSSGSSTSEESTALACAKLCIISDDAPVDSLNAFSKPAGWSVRSTGWRRGPQREATISSWHGLLLQ
mmetsp:Transcript_99025/g.154838  ORF Transcript_99025/g.154838 Transcript_99025/m.154838 type:complete len:204 (-) Transcript_99025:1075-1686(-)